MTPQVSRGQVAPTIGWRGMALITAFWTLFGTVMFASLYLSSLSRTGDATPAALLTFAFLGAGTWAALTLPAFGLTERLDLTSDEGAWRPTRVVGLLVFGLAFAVAVSAVLAALCAPLLRDSLGGRLAGPDATWVMFRYRVAHDILAAQCLLAAGIARDYFLRYRSRLAEATELRAQLADARLQILRAQLNPHFLFNTLNAIAALVQTDARSVRRMIALLSELMREALYAPSEAEVPLEREVATVRRYLEIMEIRFSGSLNARIHADPDIGSALVPHLILQPLVENALKHGVSPGSRSAMVEVAVRRHDDRLILSVRDGGAGVRNGASAPPESDREGGFGLRHTRERLRQLYGDDARLELHASPGGGTVAEIHLPYRVAPGSSRQGSVAESRIA